MKPIVVPTKLCYFLEFIPNCCVCRTPALLLSEYPIEENETGQQDPIYIERILRLAEFCPELDFVEDNKLYMTCTILCKSIFALFPFLYTPSMVFSTSKELEDLTY